MQFNKAGLASLIVGIVVLALTLAYGFGGDVVRLIAQGLVLGGISWIGLVLVVLGILIMAI